MKAGRRSISIALVATGALLIAPIHPISSFADATAQMTQGDLAISTTAINVFASAPQTFTNSGLVFSNSSQAGAPKNIWINNSGNSTLARFTMTVTVQNSAVISAIRYCGLNINFISNTTACASGSGTDSSITVSTPKTFDLTLPPNSFYAFRLIFTKGGLIYISISGNSKDIVTKSTNS